MTSRLSPLYQFKASDFDDASGLFQGLAATFGGEPDAYGDIIAPGAFTDTMREHKQAGTLPALLWAHKLSEPIGRFLEMKETPSGLEVTGKLTLATNRGAEAYALMKDSALGLSIGFNLPPGGAEENSGLRLLKKINLFEVSAVSLPANRSAKITAVKSSPQTLREFECLLRDVAGLSSRQAKCVAARGWAGIHDRDAHDAADEIATLLKQYTTQILKGH